MAKFGKLLIVDDEPDILSMLSDSLQSIVSEIQVAGNGIEALEKAQSEIFDAILSDVNMPKMNGIELLEKLRTSGNIVPFIILTGHGDKQMAIKALKLNAYDFLEKPCDSIEIVKVVSKAVELGREFNKWKADHVLVEGLEEIKKLNALEAVERAAKTDSNKK